MSSLKRFLATVSLYAVAPIGVIGLWWAAASLVDSSFFPEPQAAFTSLIRAFGFETFRESVAVTLRTLSIAFALSASIGLLVGLLAGTSRKLQTLLSPILHMLNAVPKIVFFPIFLLILGLNETSRVVFAVFSGTFIVMIVVMSATSNLAPRYYKLIDVYRLNRLTAWRMVIFPALLPHMLSALRLCLAFTFIGLIIAELLSGTYGLGGEILGRMRLVKLGEITGIVGLIVMIAVVPVMLLRGIEEKVRKKYAPSPGRT